MTRVQELIKIHRVLDRSQQDGLLQAVIREGLLDVNPLLYSDEKEIITEIVSNVTYTVSKLAFILATLVLKSEPQKVKIAKEFVEGAMKLAELQDELEQAMRVFISRHILLTVIAILSIVVIVTIANPAWQLIVFIVANYGIALVVVYRIRVFFRLIT